MIRTEDEVLGGRSHELVDIVHDLKNPLATISLELCLLEENVSVELRSRVLRVSQNIAFLDRLVHDILDAGAAEGDRLRLRRRPTELRSLIECALERSVSAHDRSRLVIEAEDPVLAVIDDLRIERVVCNLVQNAFKFAPAPSRVVVRLQVVDSHARIVVKDTGPGIDDIDRAAIFQRGRRARSPSSGGGHGLGLHIAKRIVDAHGGRIGVESTVGVGSAFFIELPLEEA